MELKLRFDFEKETKGAVRYKEVADDGSQQANPVVGSMYFRKDQIPDRPDSLIVTVNGT